MEVSPNRTHLSTTSDTSHVPDRTTETEEGPHFHSNGPYSRVYRLLLPVIALEMVIRWLPIFLFSCACTRSSPDCQLE